jgi:predicted ferric reductase
MNRIWGALFVGIQVLAVAGAWFWFQTHHPMGNLLTGDAEVRLLAWGRLAGLQAAFLILFQFVLISRSRTADRICGFDRLARVHHTLGFSLVALLVLHPVLITLGHAKQADVGYLVQLADFWMNWRGLAMATDGTALMVMALIISTPVFRSRLKYEEWHFSHLFLYVAFVLIFPHQVIAGSDFADHSVFRWYWYALNVGVLAFCLRPRGPALVAPATAPLRRGAGRDRNGRCRLDQHRRPRLDCVPRRGGPVRDRSIPADGFRWEAHPFSLSRTPNGNPYV